MRSFVSASRVVATFLFAVVVIGLQLADAADEKTTEKAKLITYDDHIKPLFRAKCLGCHNPSKKVGGLVMTSYSALRVGGGSGEVVEPGEPDSSYLWSLVTHESEPYMPPKSDKLSKAALDLIRAWIEGGALENAGSKFVQKKPTFDFSLKEVPTGKPAVPPMPLRLGLEPLVKTKLTTAITALATNPWSSLAAVAGQQQVLLYNTQSLQLVGVLPFPEGVPHVLKFSRNGSLLLAAGGRGAFRGLVVVFDVKNGKRLFEVGDELDTVLGADITADQSLIALGSSSKVVRVYSTKNSELLYEIPKKHTDWIYCAAFSPDGVLLATADRAGGLFVWEAETGRPYLTLPAHGGAVNGLSWRSDSNILASCGRDGTIRLWEMENGGQVKNWGAHGGGVESVEFCRDGNLVSCGRDRVTKLWNQGGGQIRAFPAFGDFALRVTYCDETKRLIAGDVTGEIRVWNAADGKEIAKLSPNPPKLQERLAAVSQVLAARQTEHKNLLAAYQTAQAAANKVKAELAAAQKAVTDGQARVKSATQAVATEKQTVTQVTAALETAKKQVAALAPVVPLLKETSDKSQQTAAKATDDKELAAVAAQLKSLLEKRTAALAASQKTVTDKTKELNTAKKQQTAAEKQLTDANIAVTAAQKRVVDLTASQKPADEKAAAAKQALDTATQAVANTQKEFDRWKGEIDFVQKVNTLAEREAEYDRLFTQAQETQAADDKAKSKLAAANQALSNAQKQAKSATDAVNKERELVRLATSDHQADSKLVTALEAALPLLKEALAKGQEAATKATGDKELAEIANQLKVIVDKKTAALPTAKNDLATKTAALEKSKQQLAATEKQATGASSAVAAAQKRVTDQTTAVKAAEAAAGKAKQAATAAEHTFAAAKKEVDALKGTSASAG